MNIDHKLSHGWYSLVSKHWLSRALAVFGAQYLIWIMVGILLGGYVFFLEYQLFDFGFYAHLPLLLFILVAVLGMAYVVTLAVSRKRPYEALNIEPLVLPYVKTHSFPSLHTTMAFTMSWFFLGTSLGVMMGVFAVLVALSRVAAGVHYFSDIIVGALLGFAIPTGILFMGLFIQLFYL